MVMEIQKKLVLKHLISKVLKGALPFLAIMNRSRQRRAYHLRDDVDIDDEEIESDQEVTTAATTVPEDVKEGHFAVIAMQGEETERFIVELDYLTDPDFLKLLEQASEEYGFQQKGALSIPCRPQELLKIIQNRHKTTS